MNFHTGFQMIIEGTVSGWRGVQPAVILTSVTNTVHQKRGPLPLMCRYSNASDLTETVSIRNWFPPARGLASNSQHPLLMRPPFRKTEPQNPNISLNFLDVLESKQEVGKLRVIEVEGGRLFPLRAVVQTSLGQFGRSDVKSG